MPKRTLWKIYCMEDEYPGIWRLWFKHQCVTIGYSPEWNYKIKGGRTNRDWIGARNALQEMKTDDLIVVALPGRRIGRIGKVLKNEFEQWQPLYPPDSEWEMGYMGRRISVHWELEYAPDNVDLVVQLPEGVNMTRGTLTRVKHHSVRWFQKAIADPVNWVGMAGRFVYEKALSDFIARYPERLKGGLKPYPKEKEIRERVFKDRSRADVLLRDENQNNRLVIVECKQESPDIKAVKQLRRYINLLKDETGELASGILVHGGARTIDRKIWHEANKPPQVEIFQYKLDVDFFPSC